MSEKRLGPLRPALAGAAAGLVNGFFGGGGGMVLVPLLAGWCGLDQRKAFATSVAVILPLCILSAAVYLFRGGVELVPALPYSGRRAGGGASGGQGLPPAEHDLAAAGLRPAHPLRRGQGPCSFHDGLAAPPAGRDGHRGPLRLWRGGRDPAADLYDRLRRAAPGPGPGHQSALLPPPPPAAALPAHAKNGYLERRVLLPAIAAGLACAGLGAWAATGLDGTVLRRCFGAFCWPTACGNSSAGTRDGRSQYRLTSVFWIYSCLSRPSAAMPALFPWRARAASSSHCSNRKSLSGVLQGGEVLIAPAARLGPNGRQDAPGLHRLHKGLPQAGLGLIEYVEHDHGMSPPCRMAFPRAAEALSPCCA